MQPTESELKNYYFKCGERMKILPNSRWRQIRFRDFDKKFHVIKDRIRNGSELKNWLIRHNVVPKDIWICGSCFLSPEYLSHKSKNWKGGPHRIADNIFLFGDFVLEIDNDDKKNFDRAMFELQNLGFRKFLIDETNRGFQIWVLDFYEKRCKRKIENPIRRENYFLARRKRLANELKRKGIDFDYGSTTNTRNIYRIPESVHNSGKICKIVPYDSLVLSSPATESGLQSRQTRERMKQASFSIAGTEARSSVASTHDSTFRVHKALPAVNYFKYPTPNRSNIRLLFDFHQGSKKSYVGIKKVFVHHEPMLFPSVEVNHIDSLSLGFNNV